MCKWQRQSLLPGNSAEKGTHTDADTELTTPGRVEVACDCKCDKIIGLERATGGSCSEKRGNENPERGGKEMLMSE